MDAEMLAELMEEIDECPTLTKAIQDKEESPEVVRELLDDGRSMDMLEAFLDCFGPGDNLERIDEAFALDLSDEPAHRRDRLLGEWFVETYHSELADGLPPILSCHLNYDGIGRELLISDYSESGGFVFHSDW